MLVHVTVFLFFIISVKAGGPVGYQWGYSNADGPHSWQETCAEGFRQSPIDFTASELQIVSLSRIHFVHYRRAGSVTVKNTGTSVIVSGFSNWNEHQPYVFGGGLTKYKLDHFHFHWAQNQVNGSEHSVGTLQYPAEVHFVHVKDGYSLAEALHESDGVAVVGVFLALGDDGRPLAKLNSHIRRFSQNGNSTVIHGFVPEIILPGNTEAFYRYEGSLTTPGCQESVIWTVLADPVSITKEQFESFRKLRINAGIEHNTRPVQPLNRRLISFRPNIAINPSLFGSAGISTIKIGLILASSVVTLFNFIF